MMCMALVTVATFLIWLILVLSLLDLPFTFAASILTFLISAIVLSYLTRSNTKSWYGLK